MFSTKRLAALVCAACAITAARADPAAPHLSLDDIDQMSRAKIAQQFSGGGAPTASNMSAPQPVIAASAPPAPKVVTPAAKSAEPVSFVGAYSDPSSAYVLYSYRNAVYPARVGTTLLNGWTVKKVAGYQVTVSEGKRTWTEPINSGAPTVSTNTALRSLVDLGGPLPPAAVFPGAPIAPIGRQ